MVNFVDWRRRKSWAIAMLLPLRFFLATLKNLPISHFMNLMTTLPKKLIDKKPVRILLCVIAGYFSAVLILGIVYMMVSPVSTLMISRWVQKETVKQKNIPIKNISRNIVKAVISAEDDRFCDHWGVDWSSMQKAVNIASSGEKSLGASTISMQVAKNLFLWPQRSYLRKILEIPTAMYIDLIWSKKYMLEVYLSIAEWGDGIFGVESASQKYFHKPAKNLSEWEAAQLAASLPDPLDRKPNRPSNYQNNYAKLILSRMYRVNDQCIYKR
jgi:monofunctional glycosyltransferase